MPGRGTVHYEVGGYSDVMSYGGIAAVRRLVTRLATGRADQGIEVSDG